MKDNDSLKEQLEERKAFHKRRSTKEGRATKARRKKCQVCGKWMFNVPTGKAYCSSSCKSKAANTRALAKKHEEHFSRDISELTFKEMEKVLMANGIRRGTYKQALARYANVLALIDFEQHGPEVIERLRKENPSKYVDFIIKLLPEEKNINVEHSFVNLLLEANRRHEEEKVIDGHAETIN